jgi:hypothetical protein
MIPRATEQLRRWDALARGIDLASDAMADPE